MSRPVIVGLLVIFALMSSHDEKVTSDEPQDKGIRTTQEKRAQEGKSRPKKNAVNKNAVNNVKRKAGQEADPGKNGQASDGQVKDTAIPFKAERAFPQLRLRRPLVVTHPNDGSNRLFLVSQYGVIHVIPNDQSIDNAPVFLDIESQVVYKDKENEEGLLGLAFHPQYAKNGQFFVFYTTTESPHTSVISRFQVTDDPNKADPKSEQEILRLPPKPFWNHNGGGMCFGPDGYLYISVGDGGSANDPMGNGQNLGTLFGKILRIDIDKQDAGKNYAIPKDNPFANHERAKSEIFAYGLRNVWGMSFDPATKVFWAADVGQDLWEEIDLIVKGGNYGWNLREAKHKFKNGSEARSDLIDPIWEYHHEVGKSITGGVVYRGKKFPELDGCFLYADYVTGKLWALKYDYEQKKVLANYLLQDANRAPIICFGCDQQGEVYFTDSFGQIFQIARSDTK
jgi:glucose/arabinose dehydrogenase